MSRRTSSWRSKMARLRRIMAPHGQRSGSTFQTHWMSRAQGVRRGRAGDGVAGRSPNRSAPLLELAQGASKPPVARESPAAPGRDVLREADICQHRNGLLFALDDPRLRQNTPPLHYQCRSVLTPISGYKLEKMGGRERLAADRAKMDEAPGPQVTKKGRFGNEPWPDVQGGDGAAPMPRAKPVGPKGPAEEGEAATPERTPRAPKGGYEAGPTLEPVPPAPQSPRAILPVPRAAGGNQRLDLLPESDNPINIPPRGTPWRPKDSEHTRHSSGMEVFHHPEVSGETVPQALQILDGLPSKAKQVMSSAGTRTWFLTPEATMSLEYRSGGAGERTWEERLASVVSSGAGTLLNYPKPGDITMIFVPDSIERRQDPKKNPLGWIVRHEASHAFHDSWWKLAGSDTKSGEKKRKNLRDLLDDAFRHEAGELGPDAELSPREFLAEGLAYYFEGRRALFEKRASLLYGLIGYLMV